MLKNMIRKSGAIAATLATGLALAACGSTPGDRIVSGGLLGAGGGAAIGSLSGNAGKGAVIGGVAGGTLGALTTPPPPRYGYNERYSYYARDYYSGGYTRCVRYSSYSGRCVAWRRY